MTRKTVLSVDETADAVAADASALLPSVSGFYVGTGSSGFPFPVSTKEELRLDVDGNYPQMAASGTISASLSARVHWVAKLTMLANDVFEGVIWYKDGGFPALPYTNVRIRVTRSLIAAQRKATVTFSGGGIQNRVRKFTLKSGYFRKVAFEYDTAQNAVAITAIQTHAHPNRPATLPNRQLSIETVYREAGFDVTRLPGSVVPLSDAGSNSAWSDSEMHDALQVHFSQFANRPQWSLWVFFASLHEMGTSLGGIMFDSIGPNHRQGTALFNDSFISNAPPNDPAPGAWVNRMKFWTACHEMGHAFNLAHSWQKNLGASWIPLSDEPEARSFMNYPYRVGGGQSGFFADFEYRFSNPELLFMRHAPERFVAMGAADWFDNHGFRQANVSAEPSLELQVRTHRSSPSFEFLEPIVVELKLTNVSDQPKLVSKQILSSDNLTVILKKDGRAARQFVPFAHYCFRHDCRTLERKESLYDSLFVSAGQNGWDIAEPGTYTLQVALHLEGEDVLSNPLRFRIAPPLQRDEEVLAQDYFIDDVARVLCFDGTMCLMSANATLQTLVEKHAASKAAVHAAIALASPLSRSYKSLDFASGTCSISSRAPQYREADAYMKVAFSDGNRAADTLSHIDYRHYSQAYQTLLENHGDFDQAIKTGNTALATLKARNVNHRVLQEMSARIDEFSKKKAAAG